MEITKNTNPKISIVTPCYNSVKYIHRLYNSLCRQAYKNFEWILVDDCSTDNTVEVLRSLKSPGSGGISLYVLKENSGGGVALGLGVEKSKGEIVTIIDHDDELFDSTLSIAYSEWEGIAKKPDLSGIFYRRFDPVAEKIIGEELKPGTVFSMSWLTNTKPSISDGMFFLRSVVARKYFNVQALEAICLAGVPLNLMTKSHKLIAGSSTPMIIYHRDNPESQTRSIKISRKTIYTYAKYIDIYDLYYFRRPLSWIAHITALIQFSVLLYGNPIYHHRYISSKLIVALSFALMPLGIFKVIIYKKLRVIDFPLHNLASLSQLKDIHADVNARSSISPL